MTPPASPHPSRTTLSTGVIWNLASLAFLAIVGFFLNVVIGRVYGPSDLGVFNICFSLYIFYSQLSSLGIHFSVLQAVSHNADHDHDELDRAAASGVVLTSIVALIITAVAALSTPLITLVFQIQNLAIAWLTLTPALWALPVNKVLFNIVNGAHQMRTFAVLQSMRYVVMLACLCAFILFAWPGYLLTAIITSTEFILIPIAAFCANRIVRSWRIPSQDWRRRHMFFGLRGFLAGAVAELNTRVDVLILGALINERAAGIYSVALLAFEGASQVIFAIRYNVNPRLSRFLREQDFEGLRRFSRKTILLMTALMSIVSAAAVATYPFFVAWIMQDPIYMEAYAALIILLVGQTLAAGFTSLNMVFIQANQPGVQSAFMFATLAVNATGNLILVPLFGMSGAAIATMISYVFSAAMLVVYARTTLGLRLI